MDTTVIISALMAIGGPVLSYIGYRRMYKFRLIKDTPRSKVRSLAIGIVEIHGSCEAKEYLISPFSQTKCIYYRYEVKEYRVHVRRDSKGRTTRSYSWDNIDSGENRTRFIAKDETGKVPVDPEGASFRVERKRVFLRKAFGLLDIAISAWGDKERRDLIPLDPGRLPFFGNRVGDRRYFEYFIEPESEIFIIGSAMLANKGVIIGKGENEKSFLISDQGEEAVLRKLFWESTGFLIAGAILFIIGVVLSVGYFRGG